MWAAFSLGAVVVALNGWWTGAEMSHALELTSPQVDSRRSPATRTAGGSRHRFAHRSACSRTAPSILIRTSASRCPKSRSMRTSRASCCSPAGRPGGRRRRCSPTATTSTSARPCCLGGAEMSIRALSQGPPPAAAPQPGCVISSMPLFHTSGLSGQLIAGMFTGTTTVFPEPGKMAGGRAPRTDPTAQGDDVVRRTDPTVEAPRVARARTVTTSRPCNGSPAAVPSGHPSCCAPLRSGCRDVQRTVGYGMTETTSCGTSLKSAATFDHPDSIGQPGPTVEIQIRDPSDNEVLARRRGRGDLPSLGRDVSRLLAGSRSDPGGAGSGRLVPHGRSRLHT